MFKVDNLTKIRDEPVLVAIRYLVVSKNCLYSKNIYAI